MKLGAAVGRWTRQGARPAYATDEPDGSNQRLYEVPEHEWATVLVADLCCLGAGHGAGQLDRLDLAREGN